MFRKTQSQNRYQTFSSLPQNGKVIVEYVWIGESQIEIRSKARVFDRPINSLEDVDDWTACTYGDQKGIKGTGKEAEIILHPVCIFNDPFRGAPNKIVLCETLHQDRSPTEWNTRNSCEKIMRDAVKFQPQFGIEQEYTLMTLSGWPLGFNTDRMPEPQGFYYCGVDAKTCFGRAVMEKHFKACLIAGVNICGTNSEVFPGQWEFQIGVGEGIEVADHIWVARYLLARVAEEHKLVVSYHPKPVSGDWNGSGAHCNFSTKQMRESYQSVLEAIQKLERNHIKHIKAYGISNEFRLTGKHETAHYMYFQYGVGNRNASVRIPVTTFQEKKGYIEDRRPAANMDPYVVCSLMVDTICFDGESYNDKYQYVSKVMKYWEDSFKEKDYYFHIPKSSTLASLCKKSRNEEESTIASITPTNSNLEL